MPKGPKGEKRPADDRQLSTIRRRRQLFQARRMPGKTFLFASNLELLGFSIGGQGEKCLLSRHSMIART
jgi:hypothetical protein